MSSPSHPSACACSIAASSAGLDSGYSDRVRVALHQVLVDVGARVPLVAVGDDELLLALGGPREPPLRARREPGAAATADLGGFDLLQELLRAELNERPPQTRPVPRTGHHRLIEQAVPLRLGRRPGAAGDRARDHVGAGVDHRPVANRGRGVTEPQAHRLSQRDGAIGALGSKPEAQPLAHRIDVPAAGRRPARRPGAHPHMACTSRREKIVIERRDAIHRRLRQPGDLGRAPAILIGHLGVIIDRRLEHVQRRRRPHRMMAPD
jgi:hypothetical protein